MVQVSAKNQDGSQATIEYDFGGTLQEKVERFGEDIVNQQAHRTLVLSLQSWIRAQLKAGFSPEEIQKMAADWKPGAKRSKKTAYEKALGHVQEMTPEERAQLAKQLREAKAA